ncbi:L-dopachrome tautomerase yellow-f-like [Phlebotomus argentipes]|uniref:L-dopachrome tautomerase yellow-f-like n=1 Tax=Phlebotomus argentipes TaxID=94469 RepID=UPI002892BD50|nr:L-dopachrome tautomerase yellow-f-like [Phlebotomus argentipes]
MGINHHAASGLMITTVARLRAGVPSTLNAFCLADYQQGTSPHLWGFPNYDRNTLQASFYNEGRKGHHNKNKYSGGYYNHFYGGYNRDNDYTIVSTYFPNVDERCNRLFVVDTGDLYYSPSISYNVQNPALLVYELPANGCQTRNFPLIRRVEIPNHLWNIKLGLDFINFDYQSKGSCDDVFLYITNDSDGVLIVYDYKRGEFWSFDDVSMKPVQAERFVTFEDKVYEFPLGIVSVGLGYLDKDGDRNVYFGTGSTEAEYLVSSRVLKNKKASYSSNPDDFKQIGYLGCNTQIFKHVFDPTTGVIFFGETNSKRISCWNTKLRLSPDTTGVVLESDLLLFPADMYIDSEGYLWFLGNHMPLIYLTEDPLDLTNVNSNVLRVKTTDAIRGTVCDVQNTYNY